MLKSIPIQLTVYFAFSFVVVKPIQSKLVEVSLASCFAAVYFAFSFVVVKPIQSKPVEVSLTSYLCLHHTRLYNFSTYCTHENSIMAFMTTL